MAVKHLTKSLLILAFLIVALVFSSLYFVFFAYELPRVSDSDPPSGRTDLDHYLSQKEPQFIDLKPGAQKKIIWENTKEKNKTEYVVVYLHGFSATHREIAPVPELVARDLGANLFLSRLPGHGRSSQAMAEPQVRDYLLSALEAYEIGRRLGATRKEIVIFNLSADRSHHVLAGEILSPRTVEPIKNADRRFYSRGKATSPL